MSENTPPHILNLPDGSHLAYHQLSAQEGRPCVVFLGGFMSDMTGTKATALEQFCKAKGYGFIRFDYFGHGQSSGKFTDGTITRWKNDVLTILDTLTNGPQIIIGSSMGGWLMLLAALARPEKVKALIGVASAPDFTEGLIWNVMTPGEQTQLMENGLFHQPSDYSDDPYPISRELVLDGRNHLLLDRQIPINGPVRLLHGMKDDDVPYGLSITLIQRLESNDVQLQLIKASDHRMSSETDITLLTDTLESLIASF